MACSVFKSRFWTTLLKKVVENTWNKKENMLVTSRLFLSPTKQISIFRSHFLAANAFSFEVYGLFSLSRAFSVGHAFLSSHDFVTSRLTTFYMKEFQVPLDHYLPNYLPLNYKKLLISRFFVFPCYQITTDTFQNSGFLVHYLPLDGMINIPIYLVWGC